MSFYFSSIEVRNFRSFASLRVPKLRRVNVIGGLNGVGKSAFLETLFFIVDRKNPTNIVKPLLWRSGNQLGVLDLKKFFHDGGDLRASLVFGCRDGSFSASIEYGPAPPDVSISMQSAGSPVQWAGLQTQPDMDGLSIKFKHNGSDDDLMFTSEAQGATVGNIYKVGKIVLPTAIIISSTVRSTRFDIAHRVSSLIKERRKEELLSALRILEPSLSGIDIIQENSIPSVYVDGSRGFFPTDLLGEGFQSLLSAISAVMVSKNGIVFLDEIDAALHFSIVSKVWEVIARIASDLNCQVFATSHSLERIQAVAEGMHKSNRRDDFQFMRFARGPESHLVEIYGIDEVDQSIAAGIDVR